MRLSAIWPSAATAMTGNHSLRSLAVLAAMLVLDIGHVPVALEGVAATAGRELRERLFDVYEQASRLIDPSDRWRQPDDPVVPPDEIGNIYDNLVTACLARTGGDWGHNVGYSAANLIADLAKREPGQMLPRIDVLLGAFLDAIQRIDVVPASSLEVPVMTPQSPFLAGLEEYDRRQSLGATARELLSAVEEAGKVDPMKVCQAVTALIADERDTERGIDATWRLIPLLGKLGRANGDEPRVLRDPPHAAHLSLWCRRRTSLCGARHVGRHSFTLASAFEPPRHAPSAAR